MKSPEERKTQSLMIGFIGVILWMTGGLLMKNLDAIGFAIILVALVIYFRARRDEKKSVS